MIKVLKDLVTEPIVFVTLIQLVLTAWLGALAGAGQEVPLWLAIASPASIAIGGFYARQTSKSLNG